MMKQNIALFTSPQKMKQIPMRVILMMYLNRSIIRLYQTDKNHLERDPV